MYHFRRHSWSASQAEQMCFVTGQRSSRHGSCPAPRAFVAIPDRSAMASQSRSYMVGADDGMIASAAKLFKRCSFGRAMSPQQTSAAPEFLFCVRREAGPVVFGSYCRHVEFIIIANQITATNSSSAVKSLPSFRILACAPSNRRRQIVTAALFAAILPKLLAMGMATG